jgi:GT2 family glycosyltransferase
MKTSFVILTYQRPELLAECLSSLAAAGADRRAETVVGLNGGATETEARALSERWPWARFVALPRLSRGEARNRLAASTTGELLFFLDDDATVPSIFLDRLEDAAARHAQSPILGGPNVGPRDAPPFERAVDFLLRSPLGAGPMRRRYVPDGAAAAAPGWAFMLAGLGVRREVFEREGFAFPVDCVSAEENLFLHEVENKLGPGLFCPDLRVTHRRRSGLYSFLSQVFVNGKGRAQITRAAPASLQAAVLAPTLLLAYAACAWTLPSAWAWIPAAAYAAAAAFETARMAVVEVDPAAAWRLPALFPLSHAAYAFGFWSGMLGGRD